VVSSRVSCLSNNDLISICRRLQVAQICSKWSTQNSPSGRVEIASMDDWKTSYVSL
jgi:hypothetical protein